MAQTLCYLPDEKILDPALWVQIRSWQKTQNLSSEKIRWTPDFMRVSSIEREELAGALALLRSGSIQRVVYFVPRARATQDLDWLAFACSCIQLGLPVEDASGTALLTGEKAAALQELFTKASHKAITTSVKKSSPVHKKNKRP